MVAPAPCFDDLVGLPYRWGARLEDGALDCFQLTAIALKRYTGIDWSPCFEWVYEQHGQNPPSGLLLRLLRRHGESCDWQPAAVGLFPAAGVGALSVVTEHGLLCIGPAEQVLHLPCVIAPRPRRLFRINHG